MLTAYMYPDPTEEEARLRDAMHRGDLVVGDDPTPRPLNWCSNFEIHNEDEHVIASEYEVWDHPEVPLTEEKRDAVLARMGYRRIGPWVDEDEGERAEAPVVALSWA